MAAKRSPFARLLQARKAQAGKALTRPSVEIPATTKAKDARAMAERLLGDIAFRRARIADDFYAIGVALRALDDRGLYGELGYSSFDELLADRRPVGRVTALKLMAIVEAFDQAQAVELGVEKAYALVRYTAATPARDMARALFSADARIEGRKISELTASDIARVTRVLRGDPQGPPAGAPAARDKARVVQRALRKRGLKKAVVRAQHDRGAWWLQVAVPLADADALLNGG